MTYRNRFGSLWIDRVDAPERLHARLAEGRLTEEEARQVAAFIEQGYVVLPQAVGADLIDDYARFFERSWRSPPPSVLVHTRQARRDIEPLSPDLYDQIAKVSDLHYHYPRAGEIVYPVKVQRFLELIYDGAAPVVFQTMSMRKGTEEELHIDTGPLTLTEPMSLTASWLALEDIHEDAGPLMFVPGSHRVKEVLHRGGGKGHRDDMTDYGRVLRAILAQCEERGLRTERFLARKGDVLIWAADLMHGGSPIVDPTRTRQSLVCHFMPHGVRPTFYDASQVTYQRYPSGGYHLDRTSAPPRAQRTGLGALKGRASSALATLRTRLSGARP